MSLRAIVEKTGHHFNTVKKYVDKEDWNEGPKLRKPRAPLLEPLYPVIDEWFAEDLKRPRKKELCKKTYSTAMFSLHSPGEAQVDFGEILVVRHKGAEEKWHGLVVSFPWSNAGFVKICRHETKEYLIEALMRIFYLIGGFWKIAWRIFNVNIT
jgi:hypothetical protein